MFAARRSFKITLYGRSRNWAQLLVESCCRSPWPRTPRPRRQYRSPGFDALVHKPRLPTDPWRGFISCEIMVRRHFHCRDVISVMLEVDRPDRRSRDQPTTPATGQSLLGGAKATSGIGSSGVGGVGVSGLSGSFSVLYSAVVHLKVTILVAVVSLVASYLISNGYGALVEPCQDHRQACVSGSAILDLPNQESSPLSRISAFERKHAQSAWSPLRVAGNMQFIAFVIITWGSSVEVAAS